MKIAFIFIALTLSYSAYNQTPEEQRYLDTLKMGGSYLIGRTMPDFKVVSTKEGHYSREDLNKKITFINFWAESCRPCIAEMDVLKNLYKKFKKNKKFQFLSFTFEDKKKTERLAKKYKLEYPIISLPLKSLQLLNFKKGFPTTIVTDEVGKIIYFTIGGPTDPKIAKDSIESNIYPLLKQRLKNN